MISQRKKISHDLVFFENSKLIFFGSLLSNEFLNSSLSVDYVRIYYLELIVRFIFPREVSSCDEWERLHSNKDLTGLFLVLHGSFS